jgi:PhnB protein
MQAQPYLNFDGSCEEALEFYKQKLGAKVGMMMRYKEAPETDRAAIAAAGTENKVMHATFHIGDTTLFASDGRCQGKPNFQGISLSLDAANEAEADKLFNGLADGGQVHMPMSKTFFSPRFGMLADRFGVSWMVIVPPQH